MVHTITFNFLELEPADATVIRHTSVDGLCNTFRMASSATGSHSASSSAAASPPTLDCSVIFPLYTAYSLASCNGCGFGLRGNAVGGFGVGGSLVGRKREKEGEKREKKKS